MSSSMCTLSNIFIFIRFYFCSSFLLYLSFSCFLSCTHPLHPCSAPTTNPTNPSTTSTACVPGEYSERCCSIHRGTGMRIGMGMG